MRQRSSDFQGLIERLQSDVVICAEGYLFEFERRGFLQAGAFVPEIVVERPDLVAGLHREFVHAGSDVVEAFTYYGHREKLRNIGKEHLLEPLNRTALDIARGVAEETGTLLAGGICNTNVFDNTESSRTVVREMFTEQVEWAAESDVDYVVGETFSDAEEALIALEVIKGADLPAVITLAIHKDGHTLEGWTPAEACKRIADAGADAVGLNCFRGPATMLPILEQIVAAVDIPVAALPVPYRTNEEMPTFQTLRDPGCDCLPREMPFPEALDPFTCNRYEIGQFATRAREIGVRYFGLCCGTGPHHVRAMAEALGRVPPGSRFSADMRMHSFFGTADQLNQQSLAKSIDFT